MDTIGGIRTDAPPQSAPCSLALSSKHFSGPFRCRGFRAILQGSGPGDGFSSCENTGSLHIIQLFCASATMRTRFVFGSFSAINCLEQLKHSTNPLKLVPLSLKKYCVCSVMQLSLDEISDCLSSAASRKLGNVRLTNNCCNIDQAAADAHQPMFKILAMVGT